MNWAKLYHSVFQKQIYTPDTLVKPIYLLLSLQFPHAIMLFFYTLLAY